MDQIQKSALHQFIQLAIREDVGDGDHTSLSTIPKGEKGKAHILIKEHGILAGIDVAVAIFKELDQNLELTQFFEDGQEVNPSDVVIEIYGSIHSILLAERLVLNVMQRMSGIATVTNKVVKLLSVTGTRVLDTRKTTPGMRFLEKEAVRIGGGVNHRFGLYDMILIKDNHVDFAGGIKNALDAANTYLEEHKKDIDIEIEVRSIQELNEVLEHGGIQRILLDNFDIKTLKEAVQIVGNRFVTEASGGITFENALEYALCGVDFISMGALTHSVKSLDISLKSDLTKNLSKK
ncbi:carboxylating nicotinate-nucleotide diphosphorylase [Albibacterium sp.]|uniref:carboxylating nicotinate-nucleotide diphosphorylase n=1 Tax=Albibacterium sp. TaxID=2952885 RepID=UPI002B7CE0D0|nr:carboxylating nicotinate-nucleotide diphosphorylase [Albibacterium sp.]HUH18484.1 carboxylating nicotinate-nucleotide diphosphorylase [Albibacterium sp.]